MSAISLIEVTDAPADAPAPAPVSETAPVPAVAPIIVHETPSRLMRVLPAVSGLLAVSACVISVVGMVVMSRTVAGAALVVADARERQEQLARVGKLIEELEAMRAREEAAVERLAVLRSGGAATPDDVNRAIDGLKQAIAKRDPDGGALGLVRDGQSELAERIGDVAFRLERMDAALKSRRPVPATRAHAIE